MSELVWAAASNLVFFMIGHAIAKLGSPSKIVMIWANMLEAKLRERDEKYPVDWRKYSMYYLQEHLRKERDEVDTALDDTLVGELVDESIMCMIVADKHKSLCVHDGRGR